MNPREMTRRVLEELGAERASHGYGSAAAIDLRMGKGIGYLGRVLRGEVGLHVDVLFDALEALGADPADFFVRAVGARVCPDRLLQRLERQAGGDRPAVLDHCEQLLADGAVEPAGAEPSAAELEAELARLDEQRFSEPAETLEAAEAAVWAAARRVARRRGTKSRQLLARALGVLAAIYRVQARFAPAARCLRLGLGLSAPRDLAGARADLLQRSCYLLGDQGDYRVAVEVARLAGDAWVMAKNPAGIGKALVDRAIMLNRSGEPDAAIEAYLSSLDYLPGEAWISLYSVFQGLGSIYADRREFNEARAWAEKAAAVHKTQKGQNWWRLVWLDGEIALQQGQLEAAQHALREARDGFAEQDNPLDLAVVSLRLAKALLLAGDLRQMQGLAAEMLGLLKPLEKHRIAGAAIHEFTRAALTGEVTVKLLDRACEQVKKGRPRGSAPTPSL